MNYFQLFDIPESLHIDRKLLKERFFALSRKHHPDYFVNGNDEEQQKALEMTAELNKGFRVLNDQDETVRYLLTERGLLEEEEKSALPQEFLMEMLELNEEIADADLTKEDDKQALQKKLQAINNEIYEPVAPIMEHDKSGFSEEELLRLKEYYLKKKYLKRLSGNLGHPLSSR
jgi:molecular chaperone HscB